MKLALRMMVCLAFIAGFITLLGCGGTVVRVTNPENGKAVNVVIVDRGPYGKNRKEGAIIDLSRDAARDLGILREGQARVRIDVLKWGD